MDISAKVDDHMDGMVMAHARGHGVLLHQRVDTYRDAVAKVDDQLGKHALSKACSFHTEYDLIRQFSPHKSPDGKRHSMALASTAPASAAEVSQASKIAAERTLQRLISGELMPESNASQISLANTAALHASGAVTHRAERVPCTLSPYRPPRRSTRPASARTHVSARSWQVHQLL